MLKRRQNHKNMLKRQNLFIGHMQTQTPSKKRPDSR